MDAEPHWQLDFSPAALDAQYGPDGSVAAALSWTEQVLDGRFEEAWLSTGALFRLALTRHWCWRERFTLQQAGHDPAEVAAALACDDGPGNPLWPAFACGQRIPGSGGPRAEWVAAGPPEPVGPDLEVVQLAVAEALCREHPYPTMTLLLQIGPTGWQVVGHGRTPVKVGWPPCQGA